MPAHSPIVPTAVACGVIKGLFLQFLLSMLPSWHCHLVPKPMFVMQVIMTRLGYTQASVATLPELVMQKATQACLLACACLHSTQPTAVCHCDVRFSNVLWDPEPFLADLEFAHFTPWQVMMVTFLVCCCKQLTRLCCPNALWLLSRFSRISLSQTGMRAPLMRRGATLHIATPIRLG